MRIKKSGNEEQDWVVTFDLTLIADTPPLTQGWREGHVRSGDVLLDAAAQILDKSKYAEALRVAEVLTQMAQAHYQAANVRARPL